MRLLRLKIHNIASIGDAEIDFSEGPLAKSPVFLISGETGSGKTTILDAICLALYNRTPRLSNPRSDEDFSYTDGYDTIDVRDPRQMLKKGESEGYVDLDFIGSDHQRYTAKWSVSMTTSGKIHLKAQEWVLISPDGHQDTTKTSARYARMAQVTGLDFSQFCRTSMLAQGEFTRFLKADTSEKSAILEKITGTGIYAETGKSINRKKNEANSLLKELRKEKERYAPAEGYDLEAQRLGVNSLKEKSQTDVALLREYRDAEDSRKRLAEAEKQMQDASALIGQKEATLKSMEGFMDYSMVQTAASSLSIYVSNRRKLAESLDTQKKELVEIDEKKGRLAAEEEKLKGLTASLETLTESIKNVQKQIDDMNPVKLMQTKDSVYERVEKLNSAVTNLGQVEDIREEARTAAKQKTEAQHHRDVCQRALTEAKAAVQARQVVFDAAEKIYKKVNDSVTDYTKKLRASLSVGDSCPVCGHVVEEVLHDEDFVKIFLPVKDEYDNAEAALRNAKDVLNKCKADLDGADTTLALADKADLAKADKVRRAEARFDELYAVLGVTVNTEGLPSLLKEWQAQTSEVRSELDAKLKCFHDLNDSLTTSRKKADGLRASMDEVKSGVDAIKTGLAVIEADLAAAMAMVENASTTMEEMKQKASSCFMTYDFWDEFIASPQRFIDRITEAGRVYDSLNRSLLADKTVLATASEIVVKERTVQAAFRENHPELVDGDALGSAMETLESTIESNNRLIGQIETKLQQAEDNARKYAELCAQEVDLALCCERWTELDDCFGGADGKKFRTLAQSFIMNDILSRANHYLRKITDRYEMFSQPGSLVILLRDNDEGGVLRSGNTLSGGEGFIVSLALALGLSTLGTNDLGSDIVFIDEGFGTLSPNLLELVVSTLEKISAVGGRKVGIISHVKELGDRIPAQLRLVRTDQTTCRVEMHMNQ